MSFHFHSPRFHDGQYCISPTDMQNWEKDYIKAHPERSHELMEIAGREVAQHILNRYEDTKEVLIFCGYGNNGGDGFAAAYYLMKCGIQIHLFILENGKKRSQDADDMFERVSEVPRTLIRQPSDTSKILKWQQHSHILVLDAIFGTGYKPSHNILMSRVLHCISELNCPIISVDIPSGVHALTGYCGTIEDETPPKAIIATETVTFGAPKFGHFWGEGPGHTGELFCVDIGLPVYSSRRARQLLITDEYCTQQYYGHIQRLPEVHKGQCGHVVIIGGDENMPGACCLSARSALKAGAGRVTIAAKKSMRAADEIMVSQILDSEHELDTERMASLLEQADVIVAGPGLGRDETTLQILALCQKYTKPMVLDADALWGLSQDNYHFSASELYLTPHPAEAARLCHVDKKEVLYHPLSYIQMISETYQCTTILKSHTTLVAANCGKKLKVGLLPYPNPGIASAGIGDVLAGMIGAILAQSRCGAWNRWFDAFDVSAMSVNLHSQAGRRSTEKYGNSACASDLIQEIRL